MKRRLSSGFTLIEVLVVVAIVAIVAGTATLSFSGGEARNVRRESDQLALLVRTAREQAILESRFFVIAFNRSGYEFLSPNEDGALAPVKDDLFRARRLSSGIEIVSVVVDGQTSLDAPRLVFSPAGDVSAASVEFMLGDVRTVMKVRNDGAIETEVVRV